MTVKDLSKKNDWRKTKLIKITYILPTDSDISAQNTSTIWWRFFRAKTYSRKKKNLFVKKQRSYTRNKVIVSFKPLNPAHVHPVKPAAQLTITRSRKEMAWTYDNKAKASRANETRQYLTFKI